MWYLVKFYLSPGVLKLATFTKKPQPYPWTSETDSFADIAVATAPMAPSPTHFLDMSLRVIRVKSSVFDV